MKVMVVMMLAVSLATSVSVGFGQDYDGQVGGGHSEHQNGTVESIEVPVPEPVVDENGVESVADYQIIRGAGNKPVGFCPPDNPTVDQKKLFLAYAKDNGLVNAAQIAQMKREILAMARAYADSQDRKVLDKAKAYTDVKDKAINGRVGRLGKRVRNLEDTMFGYTDKDGIKQSGVVDIANNHSQVIYGSEKKPGLISRVSSLENRGEPKGAWAIVIALIALAVAIFSNRGRSAPRPARPAPAPQPAPAPGPAPAPRPAPAGTAPAPEEGARPNF